MWDVIIAGAGPVGLTLALTLAKQGRRVLVLEKEASLSEHSRAPAIWPRTQEVLEELGVLARCVQEGLLVHDFSLFDADVERSRLRLAFEELRPWTAYPRLLILPQDKTERILYQALAANSVEVRFHAEVTGLFQSGEGVRVEYRHKGTDAFVECRYAAGCDGAHSRVRELLGFKLDGMTYSLKASLADIQIENSEKYAFPRLTRKGVWAVAIRIEKNLWRLIFPYEAGETLALDERIRRGAARLFPNETYQVIWQSDFKLHQRSAEHYVKGRVVLAGDAAHLNSPVGGQGMNAGIQDAKALGHALDTALRDQTEAPLQDYERERLQAVKGGVNRFTDRLTRILFFQNGQFFPLILAVVSMLLKLRPLRLRFLRGMAMIPRNRRAGGIL